MMQCFLPSPPRMSAMVIAGGRKGTEMPAFAKSRGTRPGRSGSPLAYTKKWGNAAVEKKTWPTSFSGERDADHGKEVLACVPRVTAGRSWQEKQGPSTIQRFWRQRQVLRRFVITGRGPGDAGRRA
jgi:hypothetical protein